MIFTFSHVVNAHELLWKYFGLWKPFLIIPFLALDSICHIIIFSSSQIWCFIIIIKSAYLVTSTVLVPFKTAFGFVHFTSLKMMWLSFAWSSISDLSEHFSSSVSNMLKQPQWKGSWPNTFGKTWFRESQPGLITRGLSQSLQYPSWWIHFAYV